MELFELAFKLSGQDLRDKQLPVRHHGPPFYEAYRTGSGSHLRVESEKCSITDSHSGFPVHNRLGSAFHRLKVIVMCFTKE